MSEPIKMRIVDRIKQKCKCTGCSKSSTAEEKEFYEMAIGDSRVYLCYNCMDMMFKKTLKATVRYQGKLKSPNKNIRR